MQTVYMIICGICGGLFFLWLKIPGGAMIGSTVGTVIFLLLMQEATLQIKIPPLLSQITYIALGIVIGSMFRPGVFAKFWSIWPAVIGSTLLILGGGLIGALVLSKFGVLGSTGAYLASSPGGLSAVAGIAAEMGEDAPMILMCQMVRLYAVLLTTPIICKILQHWLK